MSQMPQETWSRNWDIASQHGQCGPIVQQVLERLAEYGWAERERFAVELALEEALSNAICHGNRNDPDKRVRVRCSLCQARLRLEVEDEGPGFDPDSVPDCTCDQNREKPTGRGLFLMQQYMDRVCYDRRRNRLLLEKCRTTSH